MTEEEINLASARLILSTKRVKRPYTLLEIARDIILLREAKGSIGEVAKIAGVTVGMLNQFLSVLKLPENMLDLIKSRKIDSVSLAFYLSKLPTSDLEEISRFIDENKLLTQDLRTLIPYRKQYPSTSIRELLEKVSKSKNIKVSVIKIPKDMSAKSIEDLKLAFGSIIGKENIVEILYEKKGNEILLKIKKDGEKILRSLAKSNDLSLRELIHKIIS